MSRATVVYPTESVNDCPPPTATNLPDKPRLKPPSVLPDKDRKPPLSLAQEAKQLAADLGGVYAGYYERLMANTEHDREWDDIAPESEINADHAGGSEPTDPDTIQPDSPDDWDNEPFEAPEVPNNPWDDEPPEMTSMPVYGSSPATLANNTDSQNARNSIPLNDVGVTTGTTSSHPKLVTSGNPIVRKGEVGSYTTNCEQRTQEIHVVKTWMLQGMPIFKAKFDTGFAQIPNQTLQDTRLSFESKGLLSLMISLPDDWGFNNEWLMKQSPNCKKTKLTRMLRELSDCGYLIKKAKRSGDNKKLDGWDYFVFPIDTLKHPEALRLAGLSESQETSLSENQPVCKTATTNKHINKQTKTTTTEKPNSKIDFHSFWLEATDVIWELMSDSETVSEGTPFPKKPWLNRKLKDLYNRYEKPCAADCAMFVVNDWLTVIPTKPKAASSVIELHTQQEERQPALNEKQG